MHETQHIKAILDAAETLVDEIKKNVGAILLEGYRADFSVETKSANIDLVTEYDQRADEEICKAIRTRFPDHRIVAEESGEHRNEDGEPSDWIWYVDPIDGTTNFAHGHPFFAISIALYHQEQAQLGFVHAPALDVTWFGRRDTGAFRNGKAMACRKSIDLVSALAATGFPYDRHGRSADYLQRVERTLSKVRGLRRCGSAALDLSLVADGTYDFYWEEKLQPWDCAAGAFLVEISGGIISGLDGAPIDARHGSLVASAPTIHADVVTLLTCEPRR